MSIKLNLTIIERPNKSTDIEYKLRGKNMTQREKNTKDAIFLFFDAIAKATEKVEKKEDE